jgi:hypothetical protein
LTRLAAKNSPDQSGKERQSTRIIKKLTAKRKKVPWENAHVFLDHFVGLISLEKS